MKEQAVAKPTYQEANTSQLLVSNESISLQTVDQTIKQAESTSNDVNYETKRSLPASSENNAILDSTQLDIEKLQEALLAGQDPTAVGEATAAGIPASSGPGEGNEGSSVIPVVNRDGHETISDSGFETEGLVYDLISVLSDKEPELTGLGAIDGDNSISIPPFSFTPSLTPNPGLGQSTSDTTGPVVSEPSPEPSVEPEQPTTGSGPTPQPQQPEPTFTAPTISLSSVVGKSMFFTNFDIEGFKPVMGTFVDSLDGWLPKSGEKIEAWREYEEGEIPNLYGFGRYSAHSGANFIELNSAQPANGPYPAFANFADVTSATEINRVVNTQEGGIYEFSFYYSARPFFNESVTEIEVLWNNEVIETIALDGTHLKDTNWQLFKYTMIGDGEPATVTIRHTGDPSVQGRGAFLDDLQITEITGGGVVAGYENKEIGLPDFAIEYANASDKDDVQVWLRGLPQGAILSDGVQQLEVSDSEIDITDWNHQSMTIKLANDFVSNHSDANKVDIDLTIDIVKKTDQTSVTQQALRVVVLEENHYETAVDNYLIAGSGQDIFIFGQDDQSTSNIPEVDVIVGFDVAEDVLNINDLLIDSTQSLDQYLDFNFNVTDTEISISPAANDDVKQKIVLKDVMLNEVYDTTNEIEIISQLFSNQPDTLIA
ncbi:hypothetical protein [Spartinivicinus poritis]|uniref:PA14 domain-containing protein n=1 Tax=Spartinivicinus poritis TaxID=2994640 RepID=A0ABT5U8Q3_9GAMM|nr:hypothetical protein [Spartinivicinus sp. A2-2]MDE1462756.1 hypothetical protein [Spartinivicinus sp. A2-2]